jgi:hypothetical protein
MLYYEHKKAEERQDAVVGSLTQTFNLDSVLGKQATSQQVNSIKSIVMLKCLDSNGNYREYKYNS